MGTIISPRAGLWELWGGDPAVALRSTAGYAHHVPCGVSDEQSSPYRNHEGTRCT
ncbi:MAG: hypothetical protein LBU34_10730 [Planctomycetaceae bacterium]|nr:hypothetical protein [Planctomycetaceae bacterium]